MMVWKKGNSLETWQFLVHSGKLTYQCKMDPLNMYFLLKLGIFHCHVSLPEGIYVRFLGCNPGGHDCIWRGFASQYHT